jgi:hypothetical protein
MNACPHCNALLPEGFRAGDCPSCGLRVGRRGRSLSGFSIPVPAQFAQPQAPVSSNPPPRRDVVEDRWDVSDPPPSAPPPRTGTPLPPPTRSALRAPTVPGPRGFEAPGALRAPPTGFGRPAPAVAPWSDQAVRSTARLGVSELPGASRGAGRPVTPPPPPGPSTIPPGVLPASAPYSAPQAPRGPRGASGAPSAHATMSFGAVGPEAVSDDPADDWLYDRGKAYRTLGFGEGEVQALLDAQKAPAPAPSPVTPPAPAAAAAPPSSPLARANAGSTLAFGAQEIQALLQPQAPAAPSSLARANVGSTLAFGAGEVQALLAQTPEPEPVVTTPSMSRTQRFAPVVLPAPPEPASPVAPAAPPSPAEPAALREEEDPFPPPSPLPLTRRRADSGPPSAPPVEVPAPPVEAPAPPQAAPAVFVASPPPPPSTVTAPLPLVARRVSVTPAVEPSGRWHLGLLAGGAMLLGAALWATQSVSYGALFALSGAALVGLSAAPLPGSLRFVALLVPTLPTLALALLATPSVSRLGAALITAWLPLITTSLWLRREGAAALARPLGFAGVALSAVWVLWELATRSQGAGGSLWLGAGAWALLAALSSAALVLPLSLRQARAAVALPMAWAALFGLGLALDGLPTAMVLAQALCLGALPGVIGVSLGAVLSQELRASRG